VNKGLYVFHTTYIVMTPWQRVTDRRTDGHITRS